MSCVHPEMILGWLEYISGNRRILRQGGGELCPSRDDRGMVGVSRESQDTQTGGGDELVNPRMILGWSEYPGKSM